MKQASKLSVGYDQKAQHASYMTLHSIKVTLQKLTRDTNNTLRKWALVFPEEKVLWLSS